MSSNGVEIYRLPLEVFPDYPGYAHLLVLDGRRVLVDTGSGFGQSTADLLAGFAVLESDFGLRGGLACVDQVIITHGHIDHFGGLAAVKAAAPHAPLSAHELALPVLSNYEQRLAETRAAVARFLRVAGVPAGHHSRLIEMYMLGKREFEPVRVDITLHENDLAAGFLRVWHVPGHAPGLIMLQADDVLLTADHVLPGTSVALAPETIMPYTGVSHYVESLEKAIAIPGIRLALGGHDWPMDDYYAVARATREAALAKVERVYDLCDEPRTIYEIAGRVYADLDGYGELLKLEQTGARIEYLSQRGRVVIDNLDALERDDGPPLRYRQAG